VLQCVAVCCSVLQRWNVIQCDWYVAACCSVLQRWKCCVWCRVLQSRNAFPYNWYIAVCCSMLQYIAVCCSMLQYVAVCCRDGMHFYATGNSCHVLQGPHTAIHSNTLQHTPTHSNNVHLFCVAICCNALQRTATTFV